MRYLPSAANIERPLRPNATKGEGQARMKIVGNHTVRLAACPGLPWRPVVQRVTVPVSLCTPVRGLGKTRDNPRHDILAIDVGNTVQMGVVRRSPPGAALIAHGAEFLDHIDRPAESSWAQLPVPTRMLGCVVAGDAAKRRVQEQMEQMVRWDVEPQWVVSSAEEAGLTNGYDHPSRLGSDRWVAMVGARHHAGPGRHGPGGGDGGHRRDGGMH